MKNKYVPFFLLLLGFVCTACSSEQRGLAELKRLCEKDAGLTIYKTVEANGFYNAYSSSGITDYLIEGPYKFYEFCDDSPSLSKYHLFPESGCFRVKKTNRVDGQCNERVDKALSKHIVGPYPEFLQEYCIDVEKINKPEARYTYNEQLDKWLANNKYSEFIRIEVSIEGRVSNEILGQYISYSYNVRPRHSSPKSCRLLDKKYSASIKEDLIEKTIVTHKEK